MHTTSQEERARSSRRLGLSLQSELTCILQSYLFMHCRVKLWWLACKAACSGFIVASTTSGNLDSYSFGDLGREAGGWKWEDPGSLVLKTQVEGGHWQFDVHEVATWARLVSLSSATRFWWFPVFFFGGFCFMKWWEAKLGYIFASIFPPFPTFPGTLASENLPCNRGDFPCTEKFWSAKFSGPQPLKALHGRKKEG